jgi:hypothetical protein
MESQDKMNQERTFFVYTRMIAGSAALVSILQGIFFVNSGPLSVLEFSALLLAVVNLSLAVRTATTKSAQFLSATLGLFVVQFIAFAIKSAGIEAPSPLRLLMLAIIATYLAPAIAGLLARVRGVGAVQAVMFAVGFLALFLALEVIAPTPVAPGRGISVSQLITQMEPEATIGGVYPPSSPVRVYYTGNPHTKFEELDMHGVPTPKLRVPSHSPQGKWWLRVGGNVAAEFKTLPDQSDAVRVAITKASTDNGSYIQLDQQHYRIVAKNAYIVSFRARADRPRFMFVGLVGGKTWQGIGLYNKISLTPNWETFRVNFTATESDEDGTLLFDLADSDSSVDVADLNLDPTLPSGSYGITYDFNALGCRGRDYPLTRTAGVTRIVLIGNSYTLGAGVPEPSSFSHQLELKLNASAAKADPSTAPNEVINCGAMGYGTREERLFYERTAVKYRPDVVVLGMTWSDYLDFADTLDGRAPRRAGKLEYTLHTWNMFQSFLHHPPAPDYSKCVEEITRLNEACRRSAARLAVFIFRNNADMQGTAEAGKLWNQLSATVTTGLQGTNVPVLDLGKILKESHPGELLSIHNGAEPNDAAHGIAARELQTFLQRENFVK